MIDFRPGQPAIRDQGPRGTCVAFAATAAHEHVRGDGIYLSEEYLFWGAKSRDGFPHEDGTTLAAATDALAVLGQPPEVMWPYDPNRDFRSPSYRPSSAAQVAALAYRSGGSEAVRPTAKDLQAALADGRLAMLVLEIFDTWYYDVTGNGHIFLPPPGRLRLGLHAVLLVGLREDGDTNSFIIRNSWGVRWGEEGYGYLPHDYVDIYGRDARCVHP